MGHEGRVPDPRAVSGALKEAARANAGASSAFFSMSLEVRLPLAIARWLGLSLCAGSDSPKAGEPQWRARVRIGSPLGVRMP